MKSDIYSPFKHISSQKRSNKKKIKINTELLYSLNGETTITTISPNLNSPDYYLLGYLKATAYINRPEKLEDLKGNIRREISAIIPATLRSVMNNALV